MDFRLLIHDISQMWKEACISSIWSTLRTLYQAIVTETEQNNSIDNMYLFFSLSWLKCQISFFFGCFWPWHLQDKLVQPDLIQKFTNFLWVWTITGLSNHALSLLLIHPNIIAACWFLYKTMKINILKCSWTTIQNWPLFKWLATKCQGIHGIRKICVRVNERNSCKPTERHFLISQPSQSWVKTYQSTHAWHRSVETWAGQSTQCHRIPTIGSILQPSHLYPWWLIKLCTNKKQIMRIPPFIVIFTNIFNHVKRPSQKTNF